MTRRAARDWGAGGWLLLLAGLVVLSGLTWRVASGLLSAAAPASGPQDLSAYGFDLDGVLVPRDSIVSSGVGRDGIPALEHPPAMTPADVDAFNEAHRGKYLVSRDRVIGVVANGVARAYPLRVLNWHEIVNDELGGVPIAVTFNPLCDSVAVFDRRVGEEVLEFGVSGLLFNSNLLLFDRREEATGSSLWSQLQARAVAGPAAGTPLRVLPSSLTRWDEWRGRHPETTVPEPDESRLKRYQRDPYGPYLTTGRLRFPVRPLPPESSTLSMMSPVIVLQKGDRRAVYPVEPSMSLRARFEGAEIEIDGSDPASALVDAGPDVGVFYSLWFAWYSMHPDTALEELQPEG